LLAAMVRAGQNEAAERVWRDMQVAEVPPNTHTYSRLIRWRCNMGELSLAHELLREQLQSRLALKNGTYGCLIDKYYRESNYDACRQVLLDVAQAGFTPDDVALVRTIQASCAQGDVATAVWMLQQMRDLYRERRDVLIRGLRSAGWDVPCPEASMFAWAPIPPRFADMGSVEFSKLLLARANVAVAPGIGFGEHGDGHVRIALVENTQRLRQATRSIRAFLQGNNAAPVEDIAVS
ncbi:MAG: aminotransferase class I/II-fold pyridoxal phosphate-dependent enzyme, partial [Rhodospirillales bacterium]|nr:aminotransferase class I/II-fold pyridoxal phosphate-dependent enzyme [Rhodospirillales bacterium]